MLYLPEDHELRVTARYRREHRTVRNVLQILTYEFNDISLFRYVRNEEVQKVLKGQPFTYDYMLSQDPMRTVGVENYAQRLINTARVKMKLQRILDNPVFLHLWGVFQFVI